MSPFELHGPTHTRAAIGALSAGLLLCALACAPGQPARAPSPEAEPAPTQAPVSEPAAAPAPTESAAAAPGAAEAGPRDARGKEEIQAVLSANRDKVRACYDAALKNNPGIHGDVVVAFVINPDGSVKSAEVNWSESEIHVPELDSCAVDVVRGLKFPPSSRGLESKVNYPFNFNPPRQP
ncbi:MAG TPA: TonB family protein [Polyangiaceae bacterium]|nr:TonB family protein [Polyangiaceae bacterium]